MRISSLAASLFLVLLCGHLTQTQQPTTTTTTTITTTTTTTPLSTSQATTTVSASTVNATNTPVDTSTRSATSSPTEVDTDEPLTSTTDSLAVNSDEVTTAIVDETATTNEELEIEGIEPKSIRVDESDGNSLNQPNSNAKLTDAESSEPAEQTSKPAKVPKSDSKVNMSQVDEQFASYTKDENETVESWQRMSKKLKKGVGGIIGSVVPLALNLSAEAKISSNCSGAMLKWVLSMNQLKSWALRMLDAAGKPVAGMLEGSMTMFGNYRQCLKIRAPDDDEIELAGEFREYFRGKYCIIQAKPWLPEKPNFYNLNTKIKALMQSNSEDEEPTQWYDKTVFDELSEWALAFNFVNIRYDLCVPSLCSREDIQKAVNFIFKGIDLKTRVLRCEMDSPEAGAFGVSAVESSSEELADAFSAAASTDPSQDFIFSKSFSQLGWLLLPVTAIVIVLFASAISLTISDDDNQESKTRLKTTIKSLSLKRSVSSHLSVDYDQLADDKPLALYGIRFVLIMWVILVESAVNLKFEYLRELLMLKDLIFWWPLQFIINSTFQFDSIIMLTAFTMAYKNCLNDGVNKAKAISRFVIDKYIRLMPSIMVMVAMVILLPLLYKGPVWNDYVTKQSAVCQSTGWLNSIFLQNYLPYKEICLPQTWLFCVELQLVLIMAPLVYYLNKTYLDNYQNHRRDNKKTKRNLPDASKPLFWIRTTPGMILLFLIFAGMATSFYSVYIYQLPPTWLYTMADPDSKAIYFGKHLTKLWIHMAVFAMGILAGVECRRANKNIARSYRSSNLDFAGINSNHLARGNKNFSFSSSSLPVMSQSNADSLSSKANSTVSINMHNNSSSSEDIDLETGQTTNLYFDADQSATSWARIILDFFLCLVAVATMGAIIFSTHNWSLNDLPSPLIAGIFDATSRLLWSLALTWILYMLSVPDRNRNFSLVSRALGHPAMVCLGKLSFLIYLIHPFVHMTVLAIQEQPIYSSWLMLFHILIGNVTITVILSSLVSLFVEMPCRNLFRRYGTSIFFAQNSIESSLGSTATTRPIGSEPSSTKSC